MRHIDELTGMYLPDWLSRQASLNPLRPALVAGPSQITFADLDRWATTVALWLTARGVKANEPIALLLQNSLEFAALVHAAPRIPARLVPLNTRLTAPELAWMLAESGATLLVYDDPNAPTADDLARMIPELRPTPVKSITAAEQPGPKGPDYPSGHLSSASSPTGAGDLGRSLDLSAVQTIIFTSGTSGRPKGAMLTCGNHWWSAIGAALSLRIHDDDRWLAVLPFFHIGGLAILIRSVVWGITTVVHREFDPAEANRAIDEDGVTVVSVVANMLQRMLDQRGTSRYPDTLRCVLLGGGPAPRALLAECVQRRVPVVQSYGLTETASLVVALAPEDALRKMGSSGQPLLHTLIRIERDGWPRTSGEIGEILVAGPTVAAGYVNRPENISLASSGGWFHTGDFGYVDDENYLYVVDRRDDLINSGGENVYPAEVEEVLRGHPKIVDAAVVGEPDDRWGQTVTAFVQSVDGVMIDESEIIRYCAGHLAGYKVPRRIQPVNSLPRNAAGKLLRAELRKS